MQTVWGSSEKFIQMDFQAHCVFYIAVDTALSSSHVLIVLEEKVYSQVRSQCEENANPLTGHIAGTCFAFFRRCFFAKQEYPCSDTRLLCAMWQLLLREKMLLPRAYGRR